jgi:hypothetical protein
MYECSLPCCQHTLEQHMSGEENNTTCDCCRWCEPWEAPMVRPVDYPTNPFYQDDDTTKDTDL